MCMCIIIIWTSIIILGVSIHWTGLLDWTTGLTFDLALNVIKMLQHKSLHKNLALNMK